MQIMVESKENRSVYGIVDLDVFMFGDFEVNFNDETQLPRKDLMYYRDEYDYYIRLSKDEDWVKIQLRNFYF